MRMHLLLTVVVAGLFLSTCTSEPVDTIVSEDSSLESEEVGSHYVCTFELEDDQTLSWERLSKGPLDITGPTSNKYLKTEVLIRVGGSIVSQASYNWSTGVRTAFPSDELMSGTEIFNSPRFEIWEIGYSLGDPEDGRVQGEVWRYYFKDQQLQRAWVESLDFGPEPLDRLDYLSFDDIHDGRLWYHGVLDEQAYLFESDGYRVFDQILYHRCGTYTVQTNEEYYAWWDGHLSGPYLKRPTVLVQELPYLIGDTSDNDRVYDYGFLRTYVEEGPPSRD